MPTHTKHPNPYRLTSREIQILDLAALGCSNKDIAVRLAISPFTVRQHLSNIYGKVGVRTRAAAGARWREAVMPAQSSPASGSRLRR